MSERQDVEARRQTIRLVIVNDEPTPPAEPSTEVRRSPLIKDARFIDIIAVMFTIGLAFFLAHIFNSLDHADRVLYCLTAGGSNCN